MLKEAYTLGLVAALTKTAAGRVDFEDVGDATTPFIPLLPTPPGTTALVSGLTAPSGSRWRTGLGTLGGELGGTVAGGLGGAAIGGASGAGIGALINLLREKDVRKGALRGMQVGAPIGGGIGALGGASYGAHAGRQWGKE